MRLSARCQLSSAAAASSGRHTGPGDEHRLRTAICGRHYLFKAPGPLVGVQKMWETGTGTVGRVRVRALHSLTSELIERNTEDVK